MDDNTPTPRRVVWFSCGAASAVAAKLTADKHWNTDVVYCDLRNDEHPDNRRFLNDVETWIERPITIIRSDKYSTVDQVFADRRYMAGIAGAPCTVAMKKVPRFAFQEPDDIHIFGFTADEENRVERFTFNNPELLVEWPLIHQGFTKQACFDYLQRADIALPEMYALGYRNNNCLGCVKATSANYWNKVRRDFPEVFKKRAEQSRKYGARLTRVRGERVFLDELPSDYLPAEPLEDVSCGPDCQLSFEVEVSDE